jgi:mono/diheme cytochrome c family protein
MRGVLAIWAIAAATAQGAVEPVISGDSERGRKVFENEECIRCHSVDGKGGKMGADFGMLVSRSYTPAHLASTMWNHAPVMFGAIQAAGIERPSLTAGDAADLFAFFYSTRFFDKPGDAGRGKAAFAEKHCGDCHGVTESKGENAPPIAKWESLADPVVMAQQMWNHSGRMQDAFARRKIQWQQLTTAQLNDMAAWLRSLPQTRHLTSRFSNTSDRNGHKIFEEKGCAKCHVGKLALEDRLQNMTLTDIAVDMWNHAPRMVKPTPTLTQEEMRELLSFLWMRQFVYPKGSVAQGRQIFQSRQCAACHAGGQHGAPQLPGQAKRYSEVSIISAIWRHGPQMLVRMKQAKIPWPRFKNPQELGDLLAYLNSVQ